MTNKDECAGTYPVQGYTRADGTEVSGYMRTCGAAHNSNNTNDKLQRRADTLYPTMSMKHVTQKSVKNNKYQDSLSNNHKENILGGPLGQEAVEQFCLANSNVYMNTKYGKENYIYSNYNELIPRFKDYFRSKLIKQLELENLYKEEQEYKLNRVKGIYIDKDTPSARRLSETLCQNASFKQLVVNNYSNIKRGEVVSGSVQFTDKNFHNALGKADIREMRYLDNGDIDLFVTDVYDFNKNESNLLVQVGRKLQEKGKLKPYFIIYHVIITKEQIKGIKV